MNDKKNTPMTRTPAAQSTIFALVGCYMLYICYQLGYGAYIGEDSMPVWVAILFSVFFGLVGLFIIWKGWRVYQDSKKPVSEDDKANDTQRLEK